MAVWATQHPPAVAGRPPPRRYLKQVVDAAHLDVDVHLGRGVSVAEWRQLPDQDSAAMRAAQR